MYKRKIAPAMAMCAVLTATGLCAGLTGCSHEHPPVYYDPELFSEFADDFTLFVMGDDAASWNSLFVDPAGTYGYVRTSEPSWYSYAPLTKSDASTMNYVFGLYKSELNKFNPATLTETDRATYRVMQKTIADFSTLFGSKYAVDFNLIGGSYISAEGGYVADFAMSAENYSFRNESDVKDLLKITVSTENAFGTYLDYADDRAKAGYPLYDYTLCAMQDYLNEVSTQGENYYLYGFMDRKIDAAAFLTEPQKQSYKSQFKTALTDNFMSGVRTLAQGLDEYKGKVTVTEKSYLAAYGNVGRAYYKYLFESKTGMTNVDLDEVYDDLSAFTAAADAKLSDVENAAETLKTTDQAAYDDFQAYMNGEKSIVGLTEPQEILDYLKTAAKKIVPDLQTLPEIDFKYMDDTVAGRVNTVAYYLLSPIDEKDSVEHITLNPVLTSENCNELLTTMAHEGYPGHLYAHVYAKERDAGFISTALGTNTFAEGWAVYVQTALLDNIAAESDDVAVKLYCEYQKQSVLVGFPNSLMADMLVNYYGLSVDDFMQSYDDETAVREQIEILMEIPATYVSYGYGTYVVRESHNKAKTALGASYSETEYNGALLAEGNVSVPRIEQITDEYIKSKRR